LKIFQVCPFYVIRGKKRADRTKTKEQKWKTPPDTARHATETLLSGAPAPMLSYAATPAAKTIPNINTKN
jgi:hypothetical protein